MVKGTNMKPEGLKITATDTKKKRRKKRSSSGEELTLKKGRQSYGKQKKPKERKVRTYERPLDPLREQLQVLVNQANERAKAIERAMQRQIEQGKDAFVSRAYEEARRSWLRQSSRIEDDTLFKSDLATRKQINREFARVHAFLNDYTSTIAGATDFDTKLKNYKGAFGGEWKAEFGENYDKSRIDDEKAKMAFRIYRKVVEGAGGWERAVGIFQGKESLIGYGSENLIIAIYDMVENVGYDEYGHKLSDSEKEDYFAAKAQVLVEAGISAYEEMARRQRSDFDYGIVFDDETAKSRRAFYAWRFDNKKY